ncbi:MAG: hypothetical protein AB8C13_07625 [Phycisphaerales bacterium]
MISIVELWLPILVSAVAVFFASSIIWMILPYHKKDIRFMPSEDEFSKAIDQLNIEPGLYMYPNCADPKEMKSDAFVAKWKSGPWGTITVMGSPPNFAKNLLKTFVSYLAITAMCGYLASMSLSAGADSMMVFRFVGTAAILGFCMGSFAGDFFLGKPARFIFTSFIDGLIFAFITAGVFCIMWPNAVIV